MSTSQFGGTWRLQSYEIRGPHGEVSYPYGSDATGYLIYTEDGHMAAALMKANRPNFRSADIFAAGPDEKRTAYESFASYCGTYEVQEDKVIHHVEVSLFPNWSGSDQERFFEISADQLVLRTPFISAEGKAQTAIVTWQRVKPR